MDLQLIEFISFGYAGGLYDHNTGLVEFGARHYDGVVGRWLSKDPIWFAGGDSYLYGYVFNNPINLTDSTGLISDQNFYPAPNNFSRNNALTGLFLFATGTLAGSAGKTLLTSPAGATAQGRVVGGVLVVGGAGIAAYGGKILIDEGGMLLKI